jgi:hypothetical protein
MRRSFSHGALFSTRCGRPYIFRPLVDQWHERDEITASVHDQNATASAILVDRFWKLHEYFNNNRVVKSWKCIFQQNQWASVSADKGKPDVRMCSSDWNFHLSDGSISFSTSTHLLKRKKMLGLILIGVSRSHNILPRRNDSYDKIVTRKNAAGVWRILSYRRAHLSKNVLLDRTHG